MPIAEAVVKITNAGSDVLDFIHRSLEEPRGCFPIQFIIVVARDVLKRNDPVRNGVLLDSRGELFLQCPLVKCLSRNCLDGREQAAIMHEHDGKRPSSPPDRAATSSSSTR